MNATLVTSHSQTLSGLAALTTYHYRVKSRDAANNLATSGDFTFTSSAAQDTTPPGDVQNFTAVSGDQQITLSWTNPADLDFMGVRILYRTDRFPTSINDGTLLGDFTGPPNETMSTTHTGLQNGVTYYYSASSYDSSGNYQSTAHAAATPSPSNGDLSQTIGGGCGMIFSEDGRKPPGPAQAADMPALLTIMLVLLMRRRIQNLKSQVLYLFSPVAVSAVSLLYQKIFFDRCRGIFAILKHLHRLESIENDKAHATLDGKARLLHNSYHRLCAFIVLVSSSRMGRGCNA
jgi:hypothetical protein